MNIFKNVTKKSWAIGSGILIIGLATGLGIAFMTLPNKIVAVNNTKIITALEEELGEEKKKHLNDQKQIEKLKNKLLSKPNKEIADYIRLLGKKNANLEKNLKSAGERIEKLLPRGRPL